MRNNWQRFCPNITISCGSDTGLVEILYNYWLVKYRFVVALAENVLNSAKLAQIKAKIAELLNVDSVSITLEIDVTVSTGRRLLEDSTALIATVQADDEATKDYIEGNMNENLANNLEDTAGGDVTMTSVESEEASEITYGDGARMIGVSIVSLVTVFGFVAAMFN